MNKYSLHYQRKGRHYNWGTTSFDALLSKVKALYHQRIEATAKQDGERIGGVWKDRTQRPIWNYSLAQ